MKEDIDVRKDKSVDFPEFFQELQKLIDKYIVTFDKDDSVFIYSNIGSNAACLSAGRTLSQVIGLGQIMGMREDILNMLTNAIIEHLKKKGISHTHALYLVKSWIMHALIKICQNFTKR